MRLSQVLINLLSNGIKYNRPHGKVTLGFRKGDNEEGQIFVADTGRGISEDQIKSLFKPFTRLDSTDSSIPGLGMGLVISKRLVELMGAKLRVRSRKGEGSEFSIHFPMKDPKNDKDCAL